MYKILFVCHGNICRSPMAEFVLKDMVKRAELEDSFEIASAATSTEELGSGVYPPARKKLAEHGIDCAGKTARQIRPGDYEYYDYIIGMDEANMRNMGRCFGPDRDKKLHMLLRLAGEDRAVADPWYTRDFEATWQDVNRGCLALLNMLCPEVKLDISELDTRGDIFSLLRKRMLWQSWYGNNLDALHDILTGLPHLGERFVFTLPPESSPLYSFCHTLVDIFEEAGKEVYINYNK